MNLKQNIHEIFKFNFIHYNHDDPFVVKLFHINFF